MHPYILIFLLPASFHLLSYLDDNKKINNLLIISLIIIFSFSVLRGDVGGDYNLYYLRFFQNNFNFNDSFLTREFIYYQFSWIIKFLFYDFFYFKIFISILFFVPLYIFLRKTNSNLIGLVIILPLGIYLLHLGYIRQSIGFSISLLLYLSLNNKRVFDSILIFIIVIFIHVSSLMYIFPLIFLIIYKLNIFSYYEKIITPFFYFSLLLLIFLFVYLIKSGNISNYLFIFPDFLRTIIKVYLINLTHYGREMNSIGIFYRIIPSFFAVILSMILYKKNLLNCNFNLYFFYLFLFITVIIFAIFGFSTVADRLHLYFILFNILILSQLNKIFFKIRDKIFTDIFVIILIFIPLLFWLYYSKFSIKNWQPYHLGI